jgi:uncharacterized membrane protein YbaN (DUF454 family)
MMPINLLVSGVVVLALMIIGVVLTVLEFRNMK